ncbi:MAG: hypothetical protein NT124_00340 [Candidatus Dependentiae bacterium]|nr:hypothetical protein [Candidatus Dependentiae bacterium]
MNKRSIGLVVLGIIVISGTRVWGFGQKTFLGTRSQSVDAAGELVGWQQEINRATRDCCYTVFSLAAKYQRSSHPDKMAQILFGGSNLVFSGSGVKDRSHRDILADYFGLPQNFKSRICFTPLITNFMMDFDWYHGLDELLPGLYYRIHMPIVHSKWDLNLSERIVSQGTPFNAQEIITPPVGAAPFKAPAAAYPAGYLSSDRIAWAQVPKTVTEALQGKTVFGDMSYPLQFGKIFGRQELVRASDLQCAIGWNFCLSDWYHAGVAVRLVAPIGNPSEAEFLFEPMVGNGGHWEIGMGFTSHVDLWCSNNENRTCAVYVDANITHLCSAMQKRSFDLTSNGAGSRYMLLTDNGSPSQNLFFNGEAGVNKPAETQYQRRLVPAINYTTFDTKVSIGVQADIVIKCAYQHNNAEFDLGYNFWGRSKEKGSRCQRLESDRFGVKGDAQLYGLNNGDNPYVLALNATQSQATIHAGQGTGNFVPGAQYTNDNVNNKKAALGNVNTSTPDQFDQLNGVDANILEIGLEPVNGSDPALFLKDSDINMCSGLNERAITHKVFTHVNYAWRDCTECTPYIGVGGMAELAQSCFQNDNGVSQWGIWLKGGISY